MSVLGLNSAAVEAAARGTGAIVSGENGISVFLHRGVLPGAADW
jgi:hypothetical protein